MSVTVDDLKPKNFKIKIKGVELECKPLRLGQALMIAKIGNVFQDVKNASQDDIEQAEQQIDKIIADLVPELNGVQLDMAGTLELIEQLMSQVEPDDNQELKEKGVSFDSNPKG